MKFYKRDSDKIKFRAWDVINNQMVYPRIIKESFSAISSGDLINKYEVIMQFTGLVDMSDNDIYEGDIVKHCSQILYVGFGNGEFKFFSKDNIWQKYIDTNEMKIIGNIYENSEIILQ